MSLRNLIGRGNNNIVEVRAPGLKGDAGATWRGDWATATAYSKNDLVRFATNGNLYIATSAHTSSGSNEPRDGGSPWALFASIEDAEKWANEERHTLVTDLSGPDTGYSSRHGSLQTIDWASKTDGFVPIDTKSEDADGKPNVNTTTNLITFASAHGFVAGEEIVFRVVTNTAYPSSVTMPTGLTAETPYYVMSVGLTSTALKVSAMEGGPSVDITAQGTGALVAGEEYSAKAWTLGGTNVTDTANRGAAKEWAAESSGNVDGTSYSSREYAIGTQGAAEVELTGGSAKNWAQQTGAFITGAATAQSSKEWAVGTYKRGVAGYGSSKDWATHTGGVVDDASYSAKEYAQGGTASTGGSSKNWAQQTGADVTGASSGSRSAKEWATKADGAVSGTDYSAKAHASVEGTHAPTDGSAKEWATSTSVVAGGLKGAKGYAEDAAASYDSFDDRYLGTKSSDPSVDNDGSALLTGALYYNTSASNMRVYSGSAWVVITHPQDLGTTDTPTFATPTSAGHAAIKSYVDAKVPNQSGHNGKFLKTDGSDTSWEAGFSIKASGGLINDYTSGGVDYRSHTFLSSGTFVVGPNALTNVEYLVIAGGGAGAGNYRSGGGGAGGYRCSVVGENTGGGGSAETRLSLTANTWYPIVVGAGGKAVLNDVGANGSPSSFSTITSTGGGKGGNAYVSGAPAGVAGGSGGGGGGHGGSPSGAGSAASPTQGTAGGAGFDEAGQGCGGGGGGASQAGQAGGTGGTNGDGGAGLSSSIDGVATTRGGGGGAGNYGGGNVTVGGAGGGGEGITGAAGLTSWDSAPTIDPFSTDTLTSENLVAGHAHWTTWRTSFGDSNTGGGGGGGSYAGNPGGNGGSGIVIIRYVR